MKEYKIKNTTERNTTASVVEFDNIAEYVRYCQIRKKNGILDDWSFWNLREAALENVGNIYADTETAAKINAIKIDTSDITGVSPRRTKRYTETTGRVNVSKALHGVGKCRCVRKKTGQASRILNLIYDTTTSGQTRKRENYLLELAKFARVLGGLELAGVQINLWLTTYSQSKDGKKIAIVVTRVKQSSERFNPTRLAYALASPHAVSLAHLCLCTMPALWSKNRCIGYLLQDGTPAAVVKNIIKYDKYISFYDINGRTVTDIRDMLIS